jgi:putative hydrolase of the HAD superfamily
MVKAVLFDADGITTAKREKYFSQRLVDDFGVSTEDATGFVKDVLNPAMVGKVDVKEALPNYLSKWKTNKTVDELLVYWWIGENKINTDVLNIVDKLRKRGIKCYLTTDQEKYRASYIMNTMGFGQHFDGTFLSCNLGLQKHDPEFWEKVLENLQSVNP